MILYITIGFFLLIFSLPLSWSFGLSFIFHAVSFQFGSIDISSFGFLILLLRLVILNKFKLLRLFRQYDTIRIFVSILIVNIIWSISGGNNAVEFILANFRILISLFIFAHFLSEIDNIKFWRQLVFIPMVLLITHNYLLSNEIHPFYETLFEFGRLSGRTITGEMLNSNQAAYTIFVLLVIYYIFHLYKLNDDSKFKINILLLILFIFTFLISGSLGSRVVIFSLILFLPILYFQAKKIVVFLFFLAILLGNFDFSNLNLPIIGESANERIRAINSEELSKDSEMSRNIIFSSGIKIYSDNFLLGIGTGKILETMQSNKYLGHTMMLHNVYLDLAVQFGLVGIILILWLLIFGLKLIYTNSNLGFIYFITILLPNFGHNFFLLSLTPLLMVLIEFFAKKVVPMQLKVSGHDRP
jgi:O-antigen ligase